MTRDERILSLSVLVRQLANRQKTAAPRAELDDLISAAWIGAIKAVDAYDPARQSSLCNYASWRIKGELLDYLRKLDPLARDHRRKVNTGEAAGVKTFSMDAVQEDGKEWPLGRTDNAFSAAESRIDCETLAAQVSKGASKGALRRLAVVQRYFSEAGESMQEIGDAYHVKQARVSHMVKQGLADLRAAA